MSEARGATPGLSHRRAIEVTWGDCDAAGVVFYPRYYAWFDACTHAMLAAVGLGHHALRDTYGVIGTPLVGSSAKYLSPATYDDVLAATSRVTRIGRSSFTVTHWFELEGRPVVEGEEVRVWAAPDGARGMRAVEIPPAVRVVLEGK